jgi:hypothetical protein
MWGSPAMQDLRVVRELRELQVIQDSLDLLDPQVKQGRVDPRVLEV